jgi:hypothetical protein
LSQSVLNRHNIDFKSLFPPGICPIPDNDTKKDVDADVDEDVDGMLMGWH